MTPPRVTAIVVNWKLKEETLHCLQSLARLDRPCRIIVVDNGSDDGSVEYLEHHFPQAELMALPSNIGFGPACNQAITKALQDPACEYVFLFNNDAIIHPQAMSYLLSEAQAHPKAGILGPKMYFSDNVDTPNIIWHAGARRRRGVLAATDSGRGRMDRGQFDKRRNVDYIFGAGMLIRRTVFERVGFFDEKFFLYLEDMDLCLRAQAAGFELLFVPQALMWHKGSASTVNNSGIRKYHYVKSTIYFLRKHASPLLIAPIFIFWMWVSFRVMMADILQGDLTVLRSYWAGLISSLIEVRRV